MPLPKSPGRPRSNKPTILNIDTDVIKPSTRQTQFLQALVDHDYVLYGGAAGGGKSYILRWGLVWTLLAIWSVYKIQNCVVGLFCEDYPSLNDRQINKIRTEFPDWLGTLKLQSDNRHYKLHDHFGGGIIALRNLDDVSKYLCYHPETEILTRRGFVRVGDVCVGDAAATMNPATRQAEYRTVTTTHAYHYRGEMIETPANKSHAAFSVTPNHKLLGRTWHKKKLSFVEASKLPSVFYLPRQADFSDGDKPEYFDIPPVKLGRNKKVLQIPIRPFLRFLGWYLSEGSCSHHRYTIAISQLKQDGRERLRVDLQDFPYKFWWDHNSCRTSGKALHEYCASLGRDCYSKRIPREILQLHPTLLWDLFGSLMAGDGHLTSTGRWVFVSTSRGLVDDVCELAVRLGMTPTVTPAHSEPNAGWNSADPAPKWHVSITNRMQDTEIRRSRLIRKFYDGPVYCPTVPPYHNVLIRFRNRVMWCGQSAEFAAIAVDELTKNTVTTFDFLRMRLRWPGIEHPKFMAGTNPGGPGHAWVKSYWVDRKFPRELQVLAPQFHLVPAKASDNPHLTQSYWDMLQTMPKALRDAYADGRWDIFAGQYFDIFDPSNNGRHVKPPHELGIEPWSARWISVDWGFAHPAAVYWHAQTPDDRTVTYRELVEAGLSPTMLAEKIAQWSSEIVQGTGIGTGGKQVQSEKELITHIYMGPDAWAKRTDAEPVAEQMNRVFREKGLPQCTPASNDRVGGWTLMYDLLRTNRWAIGSNCTALVECLPTLVRDESKPEDVVKVDATSSTPGDDSADSCFVAGTLIATGRGEVPIEKVVTGDLVYTRVGLRRVLHSFCTGVKSVRQVTLSNGTVLTGTDSHPVWYNGDFLPLDTLRYGDNIRVCEWKPESSKESDTGVTRTPRTVPIENTLGAPVTSCIGTFGNTIAAQFRKVITSIIRMVTPRTIACRIWRYSKPAFTCPDIAGIKYQTLNIWQGFAHWLPLGINPQKVERLLVPSLQSFCVEGNGSGYGANLSPAINLFGDGKITAVSVPTRASRNGDGIVNWTMWQRFANCVERVSSAISTKTHRIVPVSVQALQVLPDVTLVYNLEVEGQPEYFANGILVHNCRYGILSRLRPNQAPLSNRIADRMKEIPDERARMMHIQRIEFEERQKSAMPQKVRSHWMTNRWGRSI